MLKENDIRPKDLMAQKKPALEHDKQFLRDHKSQFVQVDCPACTSTNHAEWAEKEGFEYHKCAECNTIFMNPRAPEDLLGEFYKQSQNYAFWNEHIFPASDDARRERIFKPRAERTVTYCKENGISGGTMLEIGAAFGTYCEAVKDQNFFDEIIAVEPTPGLAETCRKKGFKTYEETIEELSFPEEGADVIASFEVLEHIGDPFAFLSNTVRFLKKGGLFIGSCPNGQGLGVLTLKEQARVVDHEHVNYFNPDSIEVICERAGLKVLEVSTPGELDVDLLSNVIAEQPNVVEPGSFFAKMAKADQSVKDDFQVFLKKHNLSSHMWIVAQKK